LLSETRDEHERQGLRVSEYQKKKKKKNKNEILLVTLSFLTALISFSTEHFLETHHTAASRTDSAHSESRFGG
jgi:hypothetical protein